MKSMTGYGKGEVGNGERTCTVELKAVNHRFCDIGIKLPRVLICLEDDIRKTISKDVARGKIDVFVSYTSNAAEDVKISVNTAVADEYYKSLMTLKERYSMTDNITLNMLSRAPEVIAAESSTMDENVLSQVKELVVNATKEAVKNFTLMREKEGETLKADMLKKVECIAANVALISKRAPLVSESYKQRLEEKLAEYMQTSEDKARLLTEVMIFADRCCIDEELTRLSSHIAQFGAICKETVPVGKKLDFLVQEMLRETNTIGSKSNDLEITQLVVDNKNEIEKLREQIQNIE